VPIINFPTRTRLRATFLLSVLTTCVSVSLANQQSAIAQDRQALIERFRQARANGTLGRAGNGMRRLEGGGFSGRQGLQRSQQAPIDPRVWERVDRKIDLPYGTGEREKLDVYIPKSKNQKLPILISLHGGGWRMGDKNHQSGKGPAYAQNGVILVNANYGLAPQVVHPEQVLDVAKAIKYTIDHAAEWGGDPQNIYLMGHSAGAHLVDLVATNHRFLKEVGVDPTAIKGVVSLDTASLDLLRRKSEDTMEGKHIGKLIEQAFGKEPEKLKDASPTLSIKPGGTYPPFLMYCGEKRKSCLEQHQIFARQLKGVGGKLEVKAVPLSHRDINLASSDTNNAIFKECLAFIKNGKL